MQVWFVQVLNVLVAFLEAAFQERRKAPEDDFFQDSHRNSGDPNDGNDGNEQRKLQDSYAFMELEPPVTLEQAKKQYKRLSLRYHPDRNQQSQESHELMQKLNACFDRIQQALEGTGPDDEEDENDEGHDSPEEPTPEPKMPTPPPPPTQPRRQAKERSRRHWHKNKKQSKRQQRKMDRQQREREKVRQEMQRDLELERQRQQQMQTKIKQEREKIRRATRHLQDLEQREAAERLFMNEVERCREEQELRSEQAEAPTPFRLSPRTKPKHYVMESCTHEIVVAIRLGMVEWLLDLLNDQVGRDVERRLAQLHVEAYMRNHAPIREVTPELLGLADIRRKVMLQVLDEDNNTILHYAVYWEQPDIIRSLCQMAQHDQQLNEIVLAKNVHGHMAVDLASIALDPTIVPLMQSQHELVMRHLEQTRVRPALVKASKRVWTLFGSKQVDLATTIQTILAFAVGRWAFRVHTLVALVGVAVLQAVPVHADWSYLNYHTGLSGQQQQELQDVSSLVSFLALCRLGWFLLRTVYAVLGWFYMLPLIPIYAVFFRPWFLLEILLFAFGYMASIVSKAILRLQRQVFLPIAEKQGISNRIGGERSVMLLGVLLMLSAVQVVVSILFGLLGLLRYGKELSHSKVAEAVMEMAMEPVLNTTVVETGFETCWIAQNETWVQGDFGGILNKGVQ